MKIEVCERFYYRLNKQDNVSQIFNTCDENIIRNNKNVKVYDGEWVLIKLNDFRIHHVKPTETINDIVENYKIPKEQIVKDNNLVGEKLFIGQILKIYNIK